MATLQIRPDIREHHASIFGTKTVNGRPLVVKDVIASTFLIYLRGCP